ncbi:hypothetical protein F2P81_008036 [Scophthalmus maximus]|uniref:HOOK N-terminal domain-containing protein n=1 Tax=Scophthalmus maximus TaxID=52904 RepID=A0A6A4TA02_SCOMX|nr:hypothetical protein F2P81_008036 [Scophthalmus maximus]
MDANIMDIIEEFMESALAQWAQLFEKMVEREDGVPLYSQYMEVNSISQSTQDRYLRLTNGIFLNEVMRVIDPNPKTERLYDSGRDDHMLRVQNFSILNRHLRAFYQEDLQQLILMSLPNVAILGQDPLTGVLILPLRPKADVEMVFQMCRTTNNLKPKMCINTIMDLQEDKGDQILDYNQEIQTMEEQLKKLQKEEQQQLCAALQETKALLEEQLAGARARCSSLRELERDNLLFRQKIMDVEAVGGGYHKPLSVEVGEASTLRLLGAEQENAELRRRLEEIQAQQEAVSPHTKDELAGLEVEHRKMLTEVLQSEGLAMEEELCRLRSQAELHRMQTTVIATLEGERAALERDKEALRSTVDALRTAQRKSDQLELTTQTLKAELERQGRSLESSRRREEQLEAELREATLEAESLARARDQALLEASRLEQEKEVCQAELDGQRKEGRQRDREAARLRQQLESTTLALEHSNQRVRALDAEHRRVRQQLSESTELCTQLQDQEKDLSTRLTSMEEGEQQLQELCTDAQAKISSLSQDLSNEHARSQGLSTEVERLSQKLQKAKAEQKVATDSLNQSQERIECLSRCLKESESLLQLEKRRPSMDQDTMSNSNSESSNKAHLCQTHTQETSRLDQSSEASEGLDLSTTQDYAAGETERQMSERLTELEKEMDQASLSSQHSAVLGRCSEGEARRATLEAEAKVWAREREESVARMEALRRDHERMTALQQRQEVELEELLDKHSQLRSNNRSLEAQHRELEARYKEFLDGKTQIEEREREMKMEREEMEAEAQRRLERERELERLKDDNERLQAHQKEWLASQAELLAQGSVLRGELSASQLERTRLEGELSALRETNQSLDLSNARLTSQYQGEVERAPSGEAEVGGEDNGSVQSP